MNFEDAYFQEIYNSDYDRRNPRYKFRSLFNQIKPYTPKSAKLLEIGCAYGSFLKEIEGYYDYKACDISEYAVRIANHRLNRNDIFVSDVLNIKTDAKYNAVCCFDILEHVSELNKALGIIHALLEENGILCLTVPVYDTLVGKLVEYLDKDPTHVHKHSRYWWINKLQENGYSIVRWKGIWRYYFKGFYYLHYISNLTKSFTPAILVICKK